MLELPSLAFSGAAGNLRHRSITCATDDFDEYRASILHAYYPARLDLVGPRRPLSQARMSAVQLTDMTIGIVRFGAEVCIDPGDVGGYHVDIPVRGSLATSCGSQQLVATPGRAAIYTPGEHTYLSSWGADTTQVSMKIHRSTLERELGKILGRPLGDRVRFDIDFDLTTSAGRRWLSTLQILLDTLSDPDPVPDPALAAQVTCLERSLIVGLLVGQRHSMSDTLRSDPVGTRHPVALQKALDLIAATPGAQFTIADLAEAAGIGARQLQKQFHERLGTSPSEYLRNARLDGARSDLRRREYGATVSDIAFRWGFNHLGRFAYYYERKFGETPSRTLGIRAG
ncbi:transcriptional regulator, AraC family [Nocardia nova SH22a]|uniref:Transcriptional regulator, AraC family n=1 Tax=Nocardia nova SH22a TaxID=1415166 RepID=W5TKL0_9NOCA|nr:AraC family transcriptional regulator [Nocardia nova]AHH19787.1 transcriptional regulator, AraC family [Nocardia nova SH22a]